ncbi:hypothetical protein OG883_23500 [Streptomyces sp. NBC_01142]|uniref:hypothetical protein n=1 Tax=Streptomyces sp. NBC_01142 TaxID=2975865 RepID=UPI0022548F85|nr:hypothetical protein [Streptomyces sp. NBC_01142]MCX4822809.1 hypothetical protein [Streptomyces sp. NBC_01142]
MDRYEGAAHLEWWANRSTCLARIPVRIVPTAGGGTWDAAASPPLDRSESEDVQLLIEASPYFTLRCEDDVAVEVEVASSGEINHYRLSADATLDPSARAGHTHGSHGHPDTP